MGKKGNPGSDGAGEKFNPVEFVQKLRRSTVQAEVIATVRPTWMDLARALLTLRIAANELLLDGSDDRQFAPRQLLDPVVGSQAMKDRDAQASASLNTSNELVIEVLGEYLVATSDHLWAMCTLLASGPPFRPLMATGRVLVDAGAHVRYLLDPAANFRERTTRAVNVELESIREELTDITDGEEIQGEALIARRDELLAAGDADQYPRSTSKNGAAQQSFSPPLIRTGDMANLVLGDGFGNTIWRLASSVVHARDRSVLEFVGGRGDIDLSGPGLGQSMSVPYIGSCLVVMTESYKDVAEYLGRNTPLLALAIQGVFWTIKAMSGDHDEELLDKAGIDRSDWV